MRRSITCRFPLGDAENDFEGATSYAIPRGRPAISAAPKSAGRKVKTRRRRDFEECAARLRAGVALVRLVRDALARFSEPDGPEHDPPGAKENAATVELKADSSSDWSPLPIVSNSFDETGGQDSTKKGEEPLDFQIRTGAIVADEYLAACGDTDGEIYALAIADEATYPRCSSISGSYPEHRAEWHIMRCRVGSDVELGLTCGESTEEIPELVQEHSLYPDDRGSHHPLAEI